MEASVGRRAFLKRTAGGALLPATVTTLMTACRDDERTGPLGPSVGLLDGNAGQGNGGYGPLDNDNEFAGACFSPDRHTLFVNIQGATTGDPTDPAREGVRPHAGDLGPWAKGAL